MEVKGIKKPATEYLKIELTLTPQEAQDLYDISYSIGGSSESGRGTFNRLQDGLRDLGFSWTTPKRYEGTIYFKG